MSDWTLAAQMDPIEKIREELATVGIDVSIKDVMMGPGGLLTYKGEQVLLHIREKDKRFHVADCRTLNSMREQGRFERYVVATRTDGLFLIHKTRDGAQESNKELVPLQVCMNCLTTVNWRGYADTRSYPKKDKIWEEFDISDFFSEYITFFHSLPSRNDTAPPDNYVRGWSNISMQYKKDQNWTCESCKINLRKHRRLLHCYHKNGLPSDGREENLRALCMICHSEQVLHHHLKRLMTNEKRALIEELRREQGLSL